MNLLPAQCHSLVEDVMGVLDFRGHLVVLRHRPQQTPVRPPCHGYGTHPTPASWVTLTTVPGPARVPEVEAAGSCWEPGQTQPNPTPSAAVTSTAKLLLQLLLLLGSPNHIMSWLSRRQRARPSARKAGLLCPLLVLVQHSIDISYKKTANSDVWKAKASYFQLKRKAVAFLSIYYHMQVPIQRQLTFIRSRSYKVVSGRVQLHKVGKSISPSQMNPENNACLTLLLISFLTTIVTVEKAKQMGLNNHCHQ